MKLGLGLVSSIGTDCLDAEPELADHIIDEVDDIGLVVALVDLRGTNARGIVDRRVLVIRTFLQLRGGTTSLPQVATVEAIERE